VPPEPARRRVVVTSDGPLLVEGPLEVVLPDGRVWGAIVPEHCGTVIDAEIFAHTLATLLGVGELEGPARRMSLQGRARERVVKALAAEDWSRGGPLEFDYANQNALSTTFAYASDQ
jgi:hypothetical protein